MSHKLSRWQELQKKLESKEKASIEHFQSGEILLWIRSTPSWELWGSPWSLWPKMHHPKRNLVGTFIMPGFESPTAKLAVSAERKRSSTD